MARPIGKTRAVTNGRKDELAYAIKQDPVQFTVYTTTGDGMLTPITRTVKSVFKARLVWLKGIGKDQEQNTPGGVATPTAYLCVVTFPLDPFGSAVLIDRGDEVEANGTDFRTTVVADQWSFKREITLEIRQ